MTYVTSHDTNQSSCMHQLILQK